MAVRNDCIVFVAVLLTLAVASSARRLTATEAKIENPSGCDGVKTSSKQVATYSPSKNSAAVCGLTYLVTCVGDGAGGDSSNGNPCNEGDDSNFVTVTIVGECTQDCDADIQLSTDAYDSIVGVEDSEVISIDFTPTYKGA